MRRLSAQQTYDTRPGLFVLSMPAKCHTALNVLIRSRPVTPEGDCQQDAIASGHGYCGIMAMALVALRGLLPSLSGMIREHAAFFVDNPGLPLRGMPFNAA
jgi:hypothetical protein